MTPAVQRENVTVNFRRRTQKEKKHGAQQTYRMVHVNKTAVIVVDPPIRLGTLGSVGFQWSRWLKPYGNQHYKRTTFD